MKNIEQWQSLNNILIKTRENRIAIRNGAIKYENHACILNKIYKGGL